MLVEIAQAMNDVAKAIEHLESAINYCIADDKPDTVVRLRKRIVALREVLSDLIRE